MERDEHVQHDERVLVDQHRAAELLSVSVKTVQRQTSTGTIPHVKIGARVLYRPEALREWAKQQERAKIPA